MFRKALIFATAALLGSAISATAFLAGQEPSAAPPGSVQVLITVRAKHGAPPALAAQDISVHEDKLPRPVLSLMPISRSATHIHLVILIDSDSTPRLGAQFQEISRFLRALPPDAGVALAYASSGSARIVQPFTTDRATITNRLHVPFGASIGNTSIYAAFSELVRKWPGGPDGREVLLISDGIDTSYGFFETQPDENPNLREAIRDAQKNHVTVFSIFVRSGIRRGGSMIILNGQGSLAQLTSDTGGYSFSQGTHTPVSFRPYLDDLQRMLGRQYLLSFEPTSASGFRDLKMSTEVSGVTVLAPSKVFVPAAK